MIVTSRAGGGPAVVGGGVGSARPLLDVAAVRADFPILRREVHGRPLVYLDNAASCQKPRQVIDAMTRLYEQGYANIHRGVHTLSVEATEAFDAVRERVRGFVNAREAREIVFTRGTTEAINLVAQSWGRTFLHPGDEIVLTGMEHHSNIVPWQLVARERGAILRVVPFSDAGELDLDAFERLLTPRTRFITVVHVSNALGTVNPVARICERARARRIPVLVDGAQAAPHLPVDVQALGCDFYAFSGHKVYGPTGVGVLYGRADRLEAMPPWQGGGDMIESVSFERTTFAPIPAKFEAGTPPIAEVIGLGAAIAYLQGLGVERVGAWEQELLAYATARVQEVPGIRLVGTARDKASVLGFVMDGAHPHDIGTILDEHGVAIRAGHHCAQPVMDRLGLPATARASFAAYNTTAEVDALVEALHRVRALFGR